jgi:hypothetical protein
VVLAKPGTSTFFRAILCLTGDSAHPVTGFRRTAQAKHANDTFRVIALSKVSSLVPPAIPPWPCRKTAWVATAPLSQTRCGTSQHCWMHSDSMTSRKDMYMPSGGS